MPRLVLYWWPCCRLLDIRHQTQPLHPKHLETSFDNSYRTSLPAVTRFRGRALYTALHYGLCLFTFLFLFDTDTTILETMYCDPYRSFCAATSLGRVGRWAAVFMIFAQLISVASHRPRFQACELQLLRERTVLVLSSSAEALQSS